MRIIIEGCDGTGKTTLAKILADKYNLDICHCTSEDPSDYDFYLNSIRKNNVVWDRHTIGELIYPDVFSRTQQIGPESCRLILHHAKKLGAKIFVLTSDIELIKKRLMEREGEDPRILEKLESINNKFLFYAREFHIPIIDTNKMTLEDIFNLVKE